MAYNYVALFKNHTLKSFTFEQTDYTEYAILDNTFMYIVLGADSIAEELQKVSGESQDNPKIAKLTELISQIISGNVDDNPKGRIGAIYFKTENGEVFPKLYLDVGFCAFIRENFSKPILNLEGNIVLEGGSSLDCSLALKSKRVYTSCSSQEQITSLTLSAPFPLEMVQPIEDSQWVLQSFSLSIRWEEDGTFSGGNLTQNPARFLQNLFGGEGDSPPKDFTLVAANETEILCHGVILGAQSPVLAAMVKPSGTMKESESKRIEMKMFSEEVLKMFLRYIYCQAMPFEKIDCDTALGLFRLGHMYQLPELTCALSKIMLGKVEEWFTPNCILELYFLVKNLSEFKHLTDHVVHVMLKFGDLVRHSERYEELEKEEVIELLWILLNKSIIG